MNVRCLRGYKAGKSFYQVTEEGQTLLRTIRCKDVLDIWYAIVKNDTILKICSPSSISETSSILMTPGGAGVLFSDDSKSIRIKFLVSKWYMLLESEYNNRNYRHIKREIEELMSSLGDLLNMDDPDSQR